MIDETPTTPAVPVVKAEPESQLQNFDLEAAQRSAVLMDKARKAVNARRCTERPGGYWFLDDMDYPFYVGVFGKARIWTSEDGSSYDVRVYSFTGKEMAQSLRKGLDAAFRSGEKLANQELPGMPEAGQ